MKKEMGLFQLAWPIFMTNTFGILLGIIDVFVLSRVNDLAASAVGAACQVTGVSGILFGAVNSATMIMISQYMGRGSREKVSRTSAICIAINVILGLLITIVVAVNYRTILAILGVKNELYEMAAVYLSVLAFGIVLDAYTGTIGSILYSHGKTKAAMYIAWGTGGLNMVLDVILVLGLFGFPSLGVFGAAIATVASKVVCTLCDSILFFGHLENVHVFLKLADISLKEITRVFRLGIPSVFDSMNYSITQLVITGMIFHHLGQNDIIARTYLMNIAMVFSLISNALASATQIKVGYRVGASDYEGAEKDCAKCLRLSVGLTFVICLLALCFSKLLFGIFTDNPEVVRIGSALMAANIIVEIGRAINTSFIWSLRGAGDVSFPVVIAVICMWVIAVGGSWVVLTMTDFGVIAVWLVAGVDELVRGSIMTMRWKSGKWRDRQGIIG